MIERKEKEDNEQLTEIVSKNEGYDKKVDELISGGMELRRRMMLSEQNKELDLSSAIEDLLHSNSDYSGIFDPYKPSRDTIKGVSWQDANKEHRPRSKEAELESIRLNMAYPAGLGTFIKPSSATPQTVGHQDPGLNYATIQRHKLYIKYFKALDPLLKDKLNGKELTLEVLYPAWNSPVTRGQPSVVETFRFLADEDKKLEQFTLNQEIDTEMDLKRIGIQRFCTEMVVFILKIKPIVKQTGSKDLEICRGELKTEQIIMSPNFELHLKVPMRLVFEPDRVKKVAVNKNELTRIHVNTSEAGYIDLDTRLYNTEIEAAKRKQAAQPLGIEIAPVTNASREESRYFRELDSSPVCLFLHVKDARCISKPEGSNHNRNLYLEHKVYGTSDTIRSQVCWNNNSPIIDHRVIIPLTESSVEMMVGLALI